MQTVSIGVTSQQASETGAVDGVFEVTRTGDLSQALTAFYTVEGTAQHSLDYAPLPGSVTIPAGFNKAFIVIQAVDDLTEEPPETVKVTLLSPMSPFTLVILPDTQGYTAYPNLEYFASQINWITQNRFSKNIPFIMNEGDCTERNWASEWDNFKQCITNLDGIVPYALVLGNHDAVAGGQNDTGPFNQHFPVSSYQTRSYVGGVFESNRLDNAYYFFSAGGLDWLVLSLEFGPRDSVLDWANQLVAAHLHHRVIVVTHAYVYSDDTLIGSSPTHLWVPTSYGQMNDGVSMWNKFVKRHANISFVFSGHVLNDGAGRLVSVGDNGNSVYQMLANYQLYPHGGDAYLRFIEFDPNGDQFTVRSYSPYWNSYLTGPKQEFTYTNLGLFSSSNLTYEINPASASATLLILDRSPCMQILDGYATLTYPQPTGGFGSIGIDYTVNNLVYAVSVSHDLAKPIWFSGTNWVEWTGYRHDNLDGTETVSVRSRQPVQSAPSQFMRIQIVNPNVAGSAVTNR